MSGEEDTLKEHKSIVYFATTNKGKYVEAAQIASEYGIQLAHLSLEKHELQDDELTKIASFAAEEAVHESKQDRVVVEDAGFLVGALQGFPGPYSSYVYRKLGVEGIITLMKGVTKRDAYFLTALAYSEEGHSACFEGKVRGTVSLAPRGNLGFGFDPIFIPTEGDGRTFAEMEIGEKNRLSHRATAFRKFFQWLKSQQE